MVVSVGYPIGVTNTNEGCYYTVETKDKYIHLSYEELQVWSQVDSSYIPRTENDLKMVQRLESVGILLSADTKKEMLMNIFSHCYTRQGFAMIDENGNCVHLGNKVIRLTERQMAVWRFGNGKMLIEDMFVYCVKKDLLTKEELTFLLDDIVFLVDHELIYVV